MYLDATFFTTGPHGKMWGRSLACLSEVRPNGRRGDHRSRSRVLKAADKPKRYVLNKDANGNPISGHCSKCGRIFQFEDTTGVRHIEKAFQVHECKRDVQGIFNQHAYVTVANLSTELG